MKAIKTRNATKIIFTGFVISHILFLVNSSAAAEPNLKFTKIIHSVDLLKKLETKEMVFMAFPALMKAPGNQVLEIASEMSNVSLSKTQQPFAPLIKVKNKFLTIGGTCTSYFFGSSSCDSLVSFSGDNAETQTTKLNGASGLDQHDLIAGSNNTFWGMRYALNDCVGNSNLCGGNRKPPQVNKFADCEVINFDENGKIFASWSAAKSLSPTEVLWDYWKDEIFQANFADPFHCNSIDFNRTSKELLISMRHTNSIYSIDIAKNRVEWKIGGEKPFDRSLASKNPSQELILGGQHDARWVSPTSITLLDNATLTGKPARGLILSIQSQSYKILGIFEDPTQSKSHCAGSFRRFSLSGETYFVAGWGCSDNGATVFTARGKPIVSIKLEASKNNQFFRWETGPLVAFNSLLSYRIYPISR